jgi:hypothetical protein
MIAAFPPNCHVQTDDQIRPLNVDSGRPASKIFYVETLATIRAIFGLGHQQTQSERMTK